MKNVLNRHPGGRFQVVKSSKAKKNKNRSSKKAKKTDENRELPIVELGDDEFPEHDPYIASDEPPPASDIMPGYL